MRKIVSIVAPILMLCGLAAGVVRASHAEDSDERERARSSEIADRDGGRDIADRDGDRDDASDRSGHRGHRNGERHRRDDRREHGSRRRHG